MVRRRFRSRRWSGQGWVPWRAARLQDWQEPRPFVDPARARRVFHELQVGSNSLQPSVPCPRSRSLYGPARIFQLLLSACFSFPLTQSLRRPRATHRLLTTSSPPQLASSWLQSARPPPWRLVTTSPSTLPMSFCSTAWGAAMRLADQVTSYNTRARRSWYATHILYPGAELIEMQLDAGMHPAYDGLAALPFYDEFDLSTVDVLLISQ